MEGDVINCYYNKECRSLIRKIIVLFVFTAILAMQSSVLAYTITSPFGWRIHPITGKKTFHSGVDFAADQGVPIQAYFDGEVVFSGDYGGYGNAVILLHEGERYTLYGHCSRLYVVKGQIVKAGDVIAAVGSTGISTGPHLHLEYWVNHEYVDPMVIFQR
jgi:murein DD-endopeptidase MepM/ murein hydrolase activator NlpD